MKKQTAIIEKSDSFIKIMIVRGSGPSMTVTRVFKADIDAKSTVGEILEAANLSYDKMVLLIPRNKVIVKQIDLPTSDLSEIKWIIEMQVPRFTPFAKDELVYDHDVTRADPSGNSKILVGLVQNSVINTLVSQFRGESIPVSKIVFASECYVPLISFIHGALQDDTFATMDFYSDSSDFSVFSGHKLLFTKLVHFGFNDLVHDGWEDRFSDEIGSCLSEFKALNFQSEFSKVVIFNLASDLCGAVDRPLRDRFQLSTVGCGEPPGNVSFTEDAVRDFEELRGQGVSFFKHFSAGMHLEEIAIDFSPLNVKKERVLKIRRKEMNRFFLIFAAILVAGMLILGQKVFVSELKLRHLRSQVAALESETRPFRSKLKRIRLVQESRAGAHSVMAALQGVLAKVPAGIYLSEINYVRDATLSIRGTSRDNGKVFAFVESLRLEPLFRDVQVKYVTKRKEVMDFEILCQWAVPA